MRKVLFAILMFIVVGFGFVGYSTLDMDSNSEIQQESKQY